MIKQKYILFLLVSLVFVWACGGGSEKTKEPESSSPKKSKKYDIKTREGMINKLQSLGINIPKELPFVEISKKSSDYTAKFIIEDVDETQKIKMFDWHSALFEQLAAQGWQRRNIRDNEKMFGSVYNQSIFIRPRGGKSTLSDTVDITTVYDSGKKQYTLYISPNKY